MNSVQLFLMWAGLLSIVIIMGVGIWMAFDWLWTNARDFKKRLSNVFYNIESGRLVSTSMMRTEVNFAKADMHNDMMVEFAKMHTAYREFLIKLNGRVNDVAKTQEEIKQVIASMNKQVNENTIVSATMMADVISKHNGLVDYVDEEVAGLYEEIDRVCKVNEEECEYCVTCEEDREATVAVENVEGHKS